MRRHALHVLTRDSNRPTIEPREIYLYYINKLIYNKYYYINISVDAVTITRFVQKVPGLIFRPVLQVCYHTDNGGTSKCRQYGEGTKAKASKSKMKTTLIVLFDANVINRHEFVPPNTTVNEEFYKNVLTRLLARIRRVRREFYESGGCWVPVA